MVTAIPVKLRKGMNLSVAGDQPALPSITAGMIEDVKTVPWHDIPSSISGCSGNRLGMVDFKTNPTRLPIVLCSIHYRLVLLLCFKHEIKACLVEPI
jgi:hypothetical protein